MFCLVNGWSAPADIKSSDLSLSLDPDLGNVPVLLNPMHGFPMGTSMFDFTNEVPGLHREQNSFPLGSKRFLSSMDEEALGAHVFFIFSWLSLCVCVVTSHGCVVTSLCANFTIHKSFKNEQ